MGSARFLCSDLVAVLVKYYEEGAERKIVVRSAYLPYDSSVPPPTSCDTVKKNICIYLWGVTPMRITAHGVAPTATVEGRP
jgi:hypothetical protein